MLICHVVRRSAQRIPKGLLLVLVRSYQNMQWQLHAMVLLKVRDTPKYTSVPSTQCSSTHSRSINRSLSWNHPASRCLHLLDATSNFCSQKPTTRKPQEQSEAVSAELNMLLQPRSSINEPHRSCLLTWPHTRISLQDPNPARLHNEPALRPQIARLGFRYSASPSAEEEKDQAKSPSPTTQRPTTIQVPRPPL